MYLTPLKIQSDNSGKLEDLAPKKRWNIDINTQEGFTNFLNINYQIKEMCNNIQ